MSCCALSCVITREREGGGGGEWRGRGRGEVEGDSISGSGKSGLPSLLRGNPESLRGLQTEQSTFLQFFQ